MKKILKSLIALALVFALIVPTALADEEVQEPKPNYEIDVTKKLSEVTGDDAHFNGNTYTYELTGGDKELLKFEGEKTITLDPGSKAKTEKSIKLVIDNEHLQTLQPGKHTYTLKESATEVDGETNTLLGEKTIEVTVYRNVDSGKMEAVALVKDNGTDAKAKLESSTIFATNSLTVTKEVKGNNANLNDEFEFTITLKGQAGDQYKVGEDVITLTEENEATVKKSIKNGESIKVNGLSKSDTYTVVETEKGQNNVEYTTEGEVIEASPIGEEDRTVTVKNTANATIPTGVIETVAPFALVLVAAVAFGFVYFKKRSVEA